MEGEGEGREELLLRMSQLHRVLQQTYEQLDLLEEEQQQGSYSPLEPPGVQCGDGAPSVGSSFQTMSIMARHSLRGLLHLSRRVSLMRLRLLKRDIELEMAATAQHLADLLEADSSEGESSSSAEQNKSDGGFSTESLKQFAHSSASGSASSPGPPAREIGAKNEDHSPEESRKNNVRPPVRVTDSPSAVPSLNMAGTSSGMQSGANNNQADNREDQMHFSAATNSAADGDRKDSSQSVPPSEMAVPSTGFLASVDTSQIQMLTPTHDVHLDDDKTSAEEMASVASELMAGGYSSAGAASDPQEITDSESADVRADAKGIFKTHIFSTDNSLSFSSSPVTGNCRGGSLVSEDNHRREHSATQISSNCQNEIISSTVGFNSETDETSVISHSESGNSNKQDSPFSAGKFLDSSHLVGFTVSPSNSSAEAQIKEGTSSKTELPPCAHISPGCQGETAGSSLVDIRFETPTENSTGLGLTQASSMKDHCRGTDGSPSCQYKTERPVTVDTQSQISVEIKKESQPKGDTSSESVRARYNYQSTNTDANTERYSLSVTNEATAGEEGTGELHNSSPRGSTERSSRNWQSPSSERGLQSVYFSASPHVKRESEVASAKLPDAQCYSGGSLSVRTDSEGSPESMSQEISSAAKISHSPHKTEESPKTGAQVKICRFSASPQMIEKLGSPPTTKLSDSHPAGLHCELFHISTSSQARKKRRSPPSTTSHHQQETEDSSRPRTRLKTLRFSTSPQRLTKQKRPFAKRASRACQKGEDNPPSAGTRSKALRLSASPQRMVKQEIPSPTTSLNCQNEEGPPSRTRSKAVRLTRSLIFPEGSKREGEAIPQHRYPRFQSIVSTPVTTRSRSFLKFRQSLPVGNTVSSSSSSGRQSEVEISPSVVTRSKAGQLSSGHNRTKYVSQSPSKVYPSSGTQQKVDRLSTGVKSKISSSSRAHSLSSQNSPPEFQSKKNGSLSARIWQKGSSIFTRAHTERNRTTKKPKLTSTDNVHETSSVSSSAQAEATKISGDVPVKISSQSNTDKVSAVSTCHRGPEMDSPAAHTRFKFLNFSWRARNAEIKGASEQQAST
ncbi:uncharacterized protein LOC126354792 [Schistocerca gregaria]|uniref:uncharacterized protein LOC126354792 n=1 Tax=Schistocerca gregaria TaxID=7010 RepID=UPI00211EFC2C|nr:uncharacterized protein LOC126354792 [Schistocerca gregaria]